MEKKNLYAIGDKGNNKSEVNYNNVGINQILTFNLRYKTIISRVFWIALGLELLIVFLDVFVNHYKWTSIGAIRRMLNITREDGISNWFSSLQVIIVGCVLWMIALSVKNLNQNSGKKGKYYSWAGIGSFFLYMGFDDAVKFHERIGTAFETIVTRSSENSDPGLINGVLNIFPSYPWQMIFGPFLVGIGIFILWFLWKELSFQRLKYLLLIALGLYSLAVGLDFVEGLENNPYKGIANFFSTKTFRIRHMSKAIEEFFEMFGTTIFLVLFLKQLFSLSKKCNVELVDE